MSKNDALTDHLMQTSLVQYRTLPEVSLKIASNFDAEMSIIAKKYLDTGCPIGFIKSVISDFKKRMKTNQLYLTGCLKDLVEFYSNYLVVLAMIMMLKRLFIELKALLGVK